LSSRITRGAIGSLFLHGGVVSLIPVEESLKLTTRCIIIFISLFLFNSFVKLREVTHDFKLGHSFSISLILIGVVEQLGFVGVVLKAGALAIVEVELCANIA
jgi:hypothetical protein